jgi:acyl-CoA reductase-like NAD-dependent aldehyde dehydrogenase
MIDVIDSNDEELFFRVAEARTPDMRRAVEAARSAFDDGPWPQLSHEERGHYLRELGAALLGLGDALADTWPRESGALYSIARSSGAVAASILNSYADLAPDFAWEQPMPTTNGAAFGLLAREPVGVVGAIIPWNGPLTLALYKIAPALLAGCTVILKAAPEAPGAAYLIAEAAEAAELPAGVLNVLTADRAVSEELVRDPRVDKISFTGSTAVGRRIAALMGERIGRFSVELGGKSAAVILDDADLETAAATLAASGCALSGQVCAALTRIVITADRHNDFVAALAEAYSSKRVGNAFDEGIQMGPLATARQRARVEEYIAKGVAEGAKLVAGGSRPQHLNAGYFIEPTVFAGVDNSSAIAQEEIFGPVLSVIPARDEEDAIRLANDTVYGLNASVFTPGRRSCP